MRVKNQYTPDYKCFPNTTIVDPSSITEMKCVCCNRVLPISEYSTRASSRYGYAEQCKHCYSFYNLKKNNETKVLRGILEEMPYMVILPLNQQNSNILDTLYKYKAPRQHDPVYATNVNNRDKVYQVSFKKFSKGIRFNLIPLDPSKPLKDQYVKYSPRRNASNFEGVVYYGLSKEELKEALEGILKYLKSRDIRLHLGEDCEV